MSVNVSYFFNSDQNLKDLTKEINGWIGSNLLPYEGNEEDLFCNFLGMELSFGTHELDNDRELDFENYIYQIDIRIPWGNAALRDIQTATVAFIAKVLYRRMKITGMLVYDVQIILAKYEEKYNMQLQGNDFFDTISNRFVKFPQHLIDLDKLA